MGADKHRGMSLRVRSMILRDYGFTADQPKKPLSFVGTSLMGRVDHLQGYTYLNYCDVAALTEPREKVDGNGRSAPFWHNHPIDPEYSQYQRETSRSDVIASGKDGLQLYMNGGWR